MTNEWASHHEEGSRCLRERRLTHAERAFQRANSVASPVELRYSLCMLGRVHIHRGRYKKAKEVFQRVLEPQGQAEVSALSAYAYYGLGDVEHAQMRYEAAICHYERAAAELNLGAQDELLAEVYANIGLCQAMLSRLDEATESAELARTIAISADLPAMCKRAELVLTLVAQIRRPQ
jgi:tetratricopeptide (TPR) repeat protein